MADLKIENRGEGVVWTVDGPERMNSIDPGFATKFYEACRTIMKNPDPRYLLLRATPVEKSSGRFWIAGGDLTELAKLKQGKQGRVYAKNMSDGIAILSECPFPVISVVEGKAFGGGVEFALAGDFCVASADSEFHFHQLRNGLISGYGILEKLVSRVGKERAMYWLLTQQSLSATTAKDEGLIQVVTARDEIEKKIQELTTAIVLVDKNCATAQKRAINRFQDTEFQLEEFAKLWYQAPHKEALDRFRDRKKPQ